MNRKSIVLLGAFLLWIGTASGFAADSPRPHGGDPLDRGVETLNGYAAKAGHLLYRQALKWNHTITPFCLAAALAVAAWRIARKEPSGRPAANIALYLLLSLLLLLRAPEMLFHPAKGVLPNAARIVSHRLAGLSPEKAYGTNVRQWWKHWLGTQNDPIACKLSPVYARERVLDFPEGGSTAHRFLVDQMRQTLVSALHRDILPGKKLDNALGAFLLLSERKVLRLLLLLSLILLSIAFCLFSLLHLLFCGGSSLLWEITMAAALVALPLLLLGTPSRLLQIWLQFFLVASLGPILWHLLAAASYLGLTTLFAAIFGERGLFGELRETGGEMLKGMISRKSLLLSLWSLTPELPRTILLGFYEILAGLIGFCTVAITVCSTLVLGALLPLVGLGWAFFRRRQAAEALLAGWNDLHQEIARAATALGACLVAWASRLEDEGIAPAIVLEAPVADPAAAGLRPGSQEGNSREAHSGYEKTAPLS